MKYHPDIPTWVRITNNEDDRPPIHAIPKQPLVDTVTKHTIREILYTFEELNDKNSKTGLVFEFDDPGIASDEMAVDFRNLKDLPYRMGSVELIGNSRYLVSARIVDREVPDTVLSESQGDLFT